MSEHPGRILAAIPRCLLVNSGLPTFFWEELMWTATYLPNLIPHSTHDMAAPYKARFGKEADLPRLRTTGTRAFLHIEIHPKKVDINAWNGMLCGYPQDSKEYRIYNSATLKVVEKGNVSFAETRLQRVLPPGGNYYECVGPT